MTAVASGSKRVLIAPKAGIIIGERINPTGKKRLQAAYRSGDQALVLREAVTQVESGAEILDVNCGVPGIDEVRVLDETLRAVQSVVNTPMQIDTANPKALEIALRHVNGKALVNSVNGRQESMEAVFPIVKKYGGVMVGLCLDEEGIPATVEGRLGIARRIIEEGAKYGFTKDDFLIDALTLSVSTDSQAAMVTIETVRRITEELGVNTVLGVSNVSFGLPNRAALNRAMYVMAREAGLSAAIVNPATIAVEDSSEVVAAAREVLLGKDLNCEKWIGMENEKVEKNRLEVEGGRLNSGGLGLVVEGEKRLEVEKGLKLAIERGLKEDAVELVKEMTEKPLEIIEGFIVPALETIGTRFEQGTAFLPQLLMAADAAGAAFEVVRARISAEGSVESKQGARPIVLATVKGDVHDIGKNIVRSLLENYGFEVIDLGRDVAPEKVVETARRENAGMVGLSALMTTTVGAMAETISQIRAAGLDCKVCVGGAVVTQEYADQIGADFYAADAMRTVRFAESLKI